MPLWIKPTKKLTKEDVHTLMSSHFQGTFFDPSKDVGAGAEASPYRWNGLEWSSAGHEYVNERVVGTHYTAWHFVATIRPAPMPKQMAALLYWGADDHSWAPKIPIHGGASAVHPSYDDADCTARDACRRAHGLKGTVTDFSFESAWWLNQIVADQVYSRKARAAPLVLQARAKLTAQLEASLQAAESEAAPKYAAGDVAGGQQILNAHAIAAGGTATDAWQALWQRLIVTFIDGRITEKDPKNEVCGCSKKPVKFGEAWKAKVVNDAGEHYRTPATAELALPQVVQSKPTRDKLSIPGVA